MYLCTSGSNRDTISYFPIYMKHCTVSQANNDDHTLYSAPAVEPEDVKLLAKSTLTHMLLDSVVTIVTMYI